MSAIPDDVENTDDEKLKSCRNLIGDNENNEIKQNIKKAINDSFTKQNSNKLKNSIEKIIKTICGIIQQEYKDEITEKNLHLIQKQIEKIFRNEFLIESFLKEAIVENETTSTTITETKDDEKFVYLEYLETTKLEPIELNTSPEELTNDKLLDYYTDTICNFIKNNKNIVLNLVKSLNKSFGLYIETKMNMEKFSDMIQPFSKKFTAKLKEEVFRNNEIDTINLFNYKNEELFRQRYGVSETLLTKLKNEKDDTKKENIKNQIKEIIKKKHLENEDVRNDFIEEILNDVGGIHRPKIRDGVCDDSKTIDNDLKKQMKDMVSVGGAKKSNKTKMIRTIKNHHKTMKSQLKSYIKKHI
jgi:plasmid maintenance system antidote protein VapI